MLATILTHDVICKTLRNGNYNREQMTLCLDTFDDLGGDFRPEFQSCLDFSKDAQDEFDGLVDMFTFISVDTRVEVQQQTGNAGKDISVTRVRCQQVQRLSLICWIQFAER